jgi:NADH:ubiquinone oxidoreductase subunit 5 (subunit L)/multisubunit Na+/H+ antiporter MnhA subunit
MTVLLTLLLLACLVLGLLPLAPRLCASLAPWQPGLAAALAALAALQLAGRAAGGAATVTLPWLPALHLELAFESDRAGAAFALAVALVGWRQARAAAAPLIALTATAIPVLLSDNLLVTAGGCELLALVGWCVAVRVGNLDAGLTLVVRISGALALGCGVLLLGDAAGGYLRPAILAAAPVLAVQTLYWPAALLVLGGTALLAVFVPPRAAAGDPGASIMGVTALGIIVRIMPVLSARLPWPLVFAGFVATPLAALGLLWLAGLLAAGAAPVKPR